MPPLPSQLAILEAAATASVLVDSHDRFLWGNAAARDLFALDAAAAGRPVLEWFRGLTGSLMDGALPRSIRRLELSRPDQRVLVDLVVQALPAELAVGLDGALGGEARGLITATDTTFQAQAEEELASIRGRLAESERARQRLTTLQQELVEDTAPQMIGTSAALQQVRDQAARVAATDTTVLIHGETGSGKELVARAIHAGGKRRGQAFVAVNCAALPETLIESELFGHERGAFTGADRRRMGKFELADGGTLFLDEIAELPMPAQAKLLRVIQESAFERVGGAETVKVNVRLLAATHRDLARQVERGRFREDLFYRLNVFKISVPPLRERGEDLKALAVHLHERFAKRMGKVVVPLSDTSLRRLMAYPWPGNVRELANAVERATLLGEGAALDIQIPDSPLPEGMAMPRAGEGGRGGGGGGGGGGSGGGGGGGATRDILLDLSLEQLQRLQITHALESCGYKVFGADGAARKLEINPSTLLAKMDKFGIPRPRLMKRARRGGGSASGSSAG
jgi:transcriptional regulator with GAF, ATPase, and Fis domain